jgi:hypothetical protein
MSKTEDNFDHDESGSDNEDEKKAYESLLSNPSYFSSAMKVRKKMRFSFFFAQLPRNFFDDFSECC